MVDEATRKIKAKDELITHHGDSLRELLGYNFEQHPRFEQAVDEVARGRCPQYVMMDLRGF